MALVQEWRTFDSLPLLTADWPGTGGVLKVRCEDFLVEELPLYPAGGQGAHTYALIEKVGLNTLDALARIAGALGLPRREVGYAGLKDARAVTRQWISVEHVEPERLAGLHLPKISVLELRRHTNKIKLGHLAGNRFVIRLRQLAAPAEEAARRATAVLEELARRGVPNYFGPQRFGHRNDTQQLGQAIVKGQVEEFVDQFLGRPAPNESAPIRQARTLYDHGQYEQALAAWPYGFHDQRRALKALVQTGGKRRRAYAVVDRYLKRFFVSAYQSAIFNEVLAARMPRIDRLLPGDMAYKHDNGACFRVEDAAVEQPRCDRFEISPTGPLAGHKMTGLVGPAAEIENAVLERFGVGGEDLRQRGQLVGHGARRPLRFRPQNWQVSAGQDDMGEYLELQFELDAGCYATCLIREITRSAVTEQEAPDQAVPTE